MSMSRFSTGGKMLEDARKKATQSFDNAFSFASWKDGESKIIRFLHGMDTMYIFKHECGIENFEISESDALESINSGGSVECPVCNKPLDVRDIDEGGDRIGVRPGIIGASTHSAISPKDGIRRTFVCLDGTDYDCPICKVKNEENGKMQYPLRTLFYGSAVVREGKEDRVVVSGVPTMKLVGVEDSYVTDDGGEKKLDVVLLSQSWGNFWSNVDSVMAKQGAISYYDFIVTRHGQKLDTKFYFEKVQTEPDPIPFDRYVDVVPDIVKFLESTLGSPAYYSKHGWAVSGYEPESEDKSEEEKQQGVPEVRQQPLPVDDAKPQTDWGAAAAAMMSKYSG